MCGIFGFTKTKNSTLDQGIEHARESLHTLTHRGPDQWGEADDQHVYIGHRRLSIVDTSENGRQPMCDNEETIYVSANGEIYNFESLKDELKNEYSFASESDSEVLVYGYKKWGIKGLLERIEGMYAFVIYDKKLGKVFLGRDRVGVKPLYYTNQLGSLVWASELKAITQFIGKDMLDVDATAAYDFLTYLYVPAPKTIYQDVLKLEPAHYVEYDIASNMLEDIRYWGITEIGTSEDDIDTAVHKTQDLIKSAVKEQLMGDVPVGFFLSGGMDSSTVVSMAVDAKADVTTYSIGFTEETHDETAYSDMVAESLNTKHRKKRISQKDVIPLIAELKEWFDEPFADTSAFPVYIISKMARETATVVLTGDGGDEVFGGYNWYQHFRDHIDEQEMPVRSIPTRMMQFVSKEKRRQAVITHELAYYSSLMGGLKREVKDKYKAALGVEDSYDDYWHFRKYYRTDLPLMTRLQYMDFHTYLPDDILTKVDRASMRVSLECRVPLLSTDLIEYVFSLSEEVRYADGELKGLMKRALRGKIPDEVIDRKKKGFSIPTGKWKHDMYGKKTTTQEHVLKSLFGLAGEVDD